MAGDDAVKRTPGMGTLINALSVESLAPMRPAPTTTLVGLPRPRAFARLLAAVTVVMIAGLATLMLLLAHAVGGLLTDIRAHERQVETPIALALPPSDHLVDDGAFAASLNAFPSEAMHLYLSRARGLVAVGRTDAAVACYAHARQLAISGLPMADLVAEGDALVRAARYPEAMSRLLHLDFSAMDAEVRAQAVELIGCCHLAEHAAERSDRIHLSAAP
jgi:hypothetical protein